jgi:hypothetical protein
MIDQLADLTGLSREMVEAALTRMEDRPASLAAVRDKPKFLCELQSDS